MATHDLDLLENAVDSFNEALKKYQEGEDGDIKAYKFAILHYSHFLELLFKYYVSKAHPLLIYKNPFSKKIGKENTIGLWDAIQFLINEGNEIDTEFYKDLGWLKKLRNDIEHHKFVMDLNEVRWALGRLTQAMLEFNEIFSELNLSDFIEPDNLSVFEQLADEYKAASAAARKDAHDKSEDGEIYDCIHCGNTNTAIFIENKYVCMYCEGEDPVIDCCVCGEDMRKSEGSLWNDEHDEYICFGCEDRIANM